MTSDLAYLDVLGDLQDAFLSTIDEVDPRTPVPSCGRWTVRDLVVHLSQIHHWAAAQATRRDEAPLGRGPFVLDDLYATCAAELRETLTTLPPDSPAWTLDGTGPASFWHRRQTHETLVHLWDLRSAAGLAVDARPEVWADCVDEVVTVMQPRQERLGRMEPLPAPVALRADDAARSWRLGGDGQPVVTVSGPAARLALVLWGRGSSDDEALTVAGDRGALDEALARRLTP